MKSEIHRLTHRLTHHLVAHTPKTGRRTASATTEENTLSTFVERMTAPSPPPAVTGRPRLKREITRLEEQTVMRSARAQAESYVTAAKLREVDYLAKEAMTGHALLKRWSDTLSGQDPVAADELRFFLEVARIGKGEILADLVASYSREGQR